MKQIALVCCLAILALPSMAGDLIDQEHKKKLQAVIEKYHPQGKVRQEGQQFVYRFHTQMFKTHSIDKTGRISKVSHRSSSSSALWNV